MVELVQMQTLVPKMSGRQAAVDLENSMLYLFHGLDAFWIEKYIVLA